MIRFHTVLITGGYKHSRLKQVWSLTGHEITSKKGQKKAKWSKWNIALKLIRTKY